MGALFGGAPSYTPPPAPQMPVIAETPEPLPAPDKEEQRVAAAQALAQKRRGQTTRANTIIGDDTLG